MVVLTYQYQADLVPERVRQLLDALFTHADDKTAAEEWLSCFSDDARIWRNGKASNGRAGECAESRPSSSGYTGV